MRTRTRRDICGELSDSPKAWADVIDKLYGRLTALGFTGAFTPTGQKMITCRCACGAYVDVMPSNLRRGATQSCGCLHKEVVKSDNATRARRVRSTQLPTPPRTHR